MAVGGGGSSGGSSGSVRAGAAFVEIFVKPNYKGLGDLANRLGRFGKSLAKIGGLGVGLGAGLLAPLAALFKGGLDFAGQLQDLQDEFGLTAEGASKLGYAAKVAGDGLGDLEPILKGLAKANTSGKPLDEFALEFAEGLLAIEDGSARAAKAVEVLGRGGIKFLRIAGDLPKLFAEAGIFDQGTLNAADQFGQSLNKIKISAMTALLPFASQAADAAGWVAQLVRENQGLFQVLAAVGVGLVAAGSAVVTFGASLIAVSFTMKALLATWGATVAAVTFLTTPLGVLAAALFGIVAVVNELTRGGVVEFFSGWGETVNSIGTIFTETFAGIRDAVASQDMAAAAQIAMAGLEAAWSMGLARLTQKWRKFKRDLIDNVQEGVVEGGQMFFRDIGAALEIAWEKNIAGGGDAAADRILKQNFAENQAQIDRLKDEAIKKKKQGDPLDKFSPEDQKRIDEAKARLDELTNAAFLKNQERLELAMGGDGLAPALARVAAAIGSAKGLTQIASGGLAGRALGASDTGVKQLIDLGGKQLAELKKLNENAGGEFGGMVFG